MKFKRWLCLMVYTLVIVWLQVRSSDGEFKKEFLPEAVISLTASSLIYWGIVFVRRQN